MKKRRGRCRWKALFFSGITILRKDYRLSLCNCPSQLTYVGIGGISTLVTP